MKNFNVKTFFPIIMLFSMVNLCAMDLNSPEFMAKKQELDNNIKEKNKLFKFWKENLVDYNGMYATELDARRDFEQSRISDKPCIDNADIAYFIKIGDLRGIEEKSKQKGFDINAKSVVGKDYPINLALKTNNDAVIKLVMDLGAKLRLDQNLENSSILLFSQYNLFKSNFKSNNNTFGLEKKNENKNELKKEEQKESIVKEEIKEEVIDDCPICMDKLDYSKSDNFVCSNSNCGLVFCKSCVENSKDRFGDTCQYCRVGKIKPLQENVQKMNNNAENVAEFESDLEYAKKLQEEEDKKTGFVDNDFEYAKKLQKEEQEQFEILQRTFNNNINNNNNSNLNNNNLNNNNIITNNNFNTEKWVKVNGITVNIPLNSDILISQEGQDVIVVNNIKIKVQPNPNLVIRMDTGKLIFGSGANGVNAGNVQFISNDSKLKEEFLNLVNKNKKK